MKYVRISLIILLSLILFSCASTPSSVSDETDAVIDEPVSEVVQEAAAETSKTDVPEEIDNKTTEADADAENTADDNIDLNTEEKETPSDDLLHQKLDEIIEPDVIDVELPPETIDEEPEIESEPFPDAEEELEALPPVETKIESEENQDTESQKTEAEDDNNETDTEAIQENPDEVQAVESENPEETEEVAVVPDDTDEVSVIEEDGEEITVIDSDSDSDGQTEETEQVIIPSRSVQIKNLEYVDIEYPGKGWIFMGLTDNSKDLTYNGRQIGTENTKFSLQAKNPGTKILHFYKNDPVKGEFIDDYVEVIVSKEKGSAKTHVSAPEYKTPLPESKITTSEKVPETETKIKSEETETVEKDTSTSAVTDVEKQVTISALPEEQNNTEAAKTVETSTSEENTENNIEEVSQDENKTVDTEKLLEEAKKAYDSKDYQTAENKINQFLEYSSTKRDEALFMLGQIYEAAGQTQNIQKSINSYTTLITNYPASKYWDSANKRIIYLKRFYMEGR